MTNDLAPLALRATCLPVGKVTNDQFQKCQSTKNPKVQIWSADSVELRTPAEHFGTLNFGSLLIFDLTKRKYYNVARENV
jgi:hypothetical protein